jgi:CMP/dCMP kinase
MRRPPVIAIDGPAGTGKTTSAREVARRLGFAYLDSGALYRAIGLSVLRAGIGDPDTLAFAKLLNELPIRAETGIGVFRVWVGETDVTEDLRDPQVAAIASKLAVRSDVRRRIDAWLRELSRLGPSVVEGRDIGTTVFPDAPLKIFMTADIEERARRRLLDLRRHGIETSLPEVVRQIGERDTRDEERKEAPLRRASDAILIDTTRLEFEAQVRLIVAAWYRHVRKTRRWCYAAEQWSIRSVARVLWGFHVEGVENVPTAGGVILACNHKSYLDPPLVGSVLPREIYFLAKRELFRIPVISGWMRSRNVVPIDRGGVDRTALAKAMGLLAQGNALLLFPEGTRIRRPGLGAPREGIAMLAARARVPVIPALIQGSWHGERGRRLGGGIHLRFGPRVAIPEVAEGRQGRILFPEIARLIMEAIGDLANAEESARISV